MHSRWQVTFKDNPGIGADDSCLQSWADEMVWGNYSNWSQPEPGDLESPLHSTMFLTRKGMLLASDRSEENSDWSKTPQTLAGRQQQVGPLACPPGRNTILVARAMRGPKPEGHPPICKRVWALFQMPKARCHAANIKNDYSVPPTPHCINWDAFLPFNNMQFGGQNCCMKQPLKS